MCHYIWNVTKTHCQNVLTFYWDSLYVHLSPTHVHQIRTWVLVIILPNICNKIVSFFYILKQKKFILYDNNSGCFLLCVIQEYNALATKIPHLSYRLIRYFCDLNGIFSYHTKPSNVI